MPSLQGISVASRATVLAIATQHITVLEADYNPLHYFDSLGLILLAPEGKNCIQQIHAFYNSIN